MDIKSPAFKENATRALGDADLQRALGNVEKGFIGKRQKAASKLPEFEGLRDTGHIGAVEIHPKDPDTVFVAAIGNAFAPNVDRGVYRTRDGGATWLALPTPSYEINWRGRAIDPMVGCR